MNTTKKIKWTSAHHIMDKKDEQGHPVPFSVQFMTLDGRVVFIPNVVRCVSYDASTGMRKLILENGTFRNVYDVLILYINNTRVVVS